MTDDMGRTLPPDVLASALQDRIHPSSGRLISAKPVTDDMGRTPISAGMKQMIADAFAAVPEGKRGAVLVIVDRETQTARAHLAAKLGERWKVAAGSSFPWAEPRKTQGWVGVEIAW